MFFIEEKNDQESTLETYIAYLLEDKLIEFSSEDVDGRKYKLTRKGKEVILMPTFEMVKYHRHNYPKNIECKIEEIAGHFDIAEIHPNMEYSLHTEYSYGKRKWTSELLTGLDEICNANKNGVPQLWISEKWASEFAQFVTRVTINRHFPKVIEIHPPFSDYSRSIDIFIKVYAAFEDVVRSHHPDTMILIENRAGSTYHDGSFLISKREQIAELCEQIEKANLHLKIALDIPQLYTAHHVDQSNPSLITSLLSDITEIRQYIKGVHLWGKRLTEKGRLVAHCGDFDSYFHDDLKLKAAFLSAMSELFDDSICRNLVLEVNSGSDDLDSIIDDLRVARFKYI